MTHKLIEQMLTVLEDWATPMGESKYQLGELDEHIQAAIAAAKSHLALQQHTDLYQEMEQPVSMEPVGEVVEDDFSRQLKGIGKWHSLPSGTKLYTHPAPEPVSMKPVAVVRWNDIGHITWHTNDLLPDDTKLFTATQLAAARQQGAETRDTEDAQRVAQQAMKIAALEAALKEWLDKTEWVQQDAAVNELGMHRADVLKQRITELEQKNAQLLEALKSAEPAIAVGYGLTRVKVLNAIAAAEVKP